MPALNQVERDRPAHRTAPTLDAGVSHEPQPSLFGHGVTAREALAPDVGHGGLGANGIRVNGGDFHGAGGEGFSSAARGEAIPKPGKFVIRDYFHDSAR
jgi:hypothetical protein